MDANGLLTIVVFCALVLALTPLLGRYMTAVFDGQVKGLGWLERPVYRLCGTSADEEQHWSRYALSLLAFSAVGMLLLYALQRLQGGLPWNPAGLAGVAPDLAFNTAASFVTNTNWQSYGGETTLSYLTQMAGMTVQNFVSAAVGIAVAIALIRGFARHSARTVGNFTVDVTRAVLYLLLPLCVVGALALVALGVPQNLSAYTSVTTLEGAQQLIAQGPVASQMMIKHLGTNGGGFFNVNAAHPFENPSALTNLIHMVAIFAIGAGLTNTFGRMVGSQRQGWVLLTAMAILFGLSLAVALGAEVQGHPLLAAHGIDQLASPWQSGGFLEGKEVRFGVVTSVLFSIVTTAASCGAVIAMHDSLLPLAGMMPLLNMMLGEVIIGGVGAGLYGMMLFVLLAVFIAGLMVGRTPEYLGKKIEGRDMTLALLAILAFPLCIFGLGSIAMVWGQGAIQDAGPHGLSELVYAYVSATANNGSAFAGFSANTLLHNILLGLAMLAGRFMVIIPLLAIAGAMAARKTIPPSAGTFPTDGGLFVVLLIMVVLVIGGLTFFPLLALGPLAEHLTLAAGTLF